MTDHSAADLPDARLVLVDLHDKYARHGGYAVSREIRPS
jgi:hypothetical protein